MIQVCGTSFALSFAPPRVGRELVLLGVVPVGAIMQQGGGAWCWQLELPMARAPRRARSRAEAVRGVEAAIADWLAAAGAAGAGR